MVCLPRKTIKNTGVLPRCSIPYNAEVQKHLGRWVRCFDEMLRDAEPLLRRIEALEQRYRELYLPFSDSALKIVRQLKAMPEYLELQDTLFEVNLKCSSPSSFESVERNLMRNQYACVCDFIEDSRLVVTNVYQYVEEDILAWPAARRIERVMEDCFVDELRRPKLHTFVEERLRECSQGVVQKIQRVLEAYGEVDTPFRNLSNATLQAICRCLPEMNPPLEPLISVAPTVPLTMTPGDVHGQTNAHVVSAVTNQPPSPATPGLTTMQQNAHTATFFDEISPVHLSDDSASDSDNAFAVDHVAASCNVIGVAPDSTAGLNGAGKPDGEVEDLAIEFE